MKNRFRNFRKLAKTVCAAAAAAALHTPCAQAAFGDSVYLVYLNPFKVQEQEVLARRAGYVPPAIPAVVEKSEQEKYILGNIDRFLRSPGVDAVRQSLVRDFSLSDVEEKPLGIPAFTARLNARELRALELSDQVVSVTRVYPDRQAAEFSGWSDYKDWNEIVPWGKQAVGADDDITVSDTRFFLVDSHINSRAMANEINLISTDSKPDDYNGHAAAVLSVAVAKRNNYGVRGINPGQPVVHLGLSSLSDIDMIMGIARIASIAEWMGQFATLNLSFNKLSWDLESSVFRHDGVVGKVVRRASGRLFVTQSAGNNDSNACLASFGYEGAARANDGIMVVGGTDQSGGRYPQPTNSCDFDSKSRSNYGSCVEAWAPGWKMSIMNERGIINGYDEKVCSTTGTSFAAPIVAAIAARYGDASTRPIEREAYIRNSLVFTGHHENAPDSNLPIMQVRYSPFNRHNIPQRLPVSGVFSKTHTENLDSLIDEKFYGGIHWNAHGGWGSVVLDLGTRRNITGVRVMIRSSADGGMLNFAVHGGNSLINLGARRAEIPPNPIAYLNTTDQFDLTPYYIPVGGNYRYVMIEAANMASWLSYSEVEVYGY